MCTYGKGIRSVLRLSCPTYLNAADSFNQATCHYSRPRSGIAANGRKPQVFLLRRNCFYWDKEAKTKVSLNFTILWIFGEGLTAIRGLL